MIKVRVTSTGELVIHRVTNNVHRVSIAEEIRKGTELEIMTRENPRWDEFCDRLEGPEGCNFRQDKNGEWIWNCGTKMSAAIGILEKMEGIDIPASLEYFEGQHACCSCEILFNVNREGGIL